MRSNTAIALAALAFSALGGAALAACGSDSGTDVPLGDDGGQDGSQDGAIGSGDAPSDQSSSSDGGACGLVGASCATGGDCCSASCDPQAKICAKPVGSCKTAGASCAAGNECCTFVCSGGACGAN